MSEANKQPNHSTWTDLWNTDVTQAGLPWLSSQSPQPQAASESLCRSSMVSLLSRSLASLNWSHCPLLQACCPGKPSGSSRVTTQASWAWLTCDWQAGQRTAMRMPLKKRHPAKSRLIPGYPGPAENFKFGYLGNHLEVNSAHSLVWQQPLLLTKEISLCRTKVHQTSWHPITFA